MAARRTTMNIDHELVAQAQDILGTDTATATVHRALTDVIRRFHVDGLLEWDFNGMTNEQVEAMDVIEEVARGSVGREAS